MNHLIKSQSLGELEQRIMNIIWEYKPCSIRYILTKLQKKKKIAYTTIATVLQRLYEKQLVERKTKNNHYIYTSHFNKKTYSLRLIKNFLNGFINNFGDVAIVSFAESLDSLPKRKRDYLLKLLNEKK